MAPGLSDMVAELERLVDEVEGHDREVRARVIELGNELAALCKRASTWAIGEEFDIEDEGNAEDRVYGWLGVTSRGIYLAHRSVMDDLNDEINGVPPEEQGYNMSWPESWDTRWLRSVATEEHLQTILVGLKNRLSELKDGRARAAGSVRELRRTPPPDVEDALIAAAQEFNFGRLSTEWGKAQRLLAIDPESALTAACSLVESTLKHIIKRRCLELPANESIQHLYKVVAKSIVFSDETAPHDLRDMGRALTSLVQHVGALRTKAGDAHGKDPEHRVATQNAAQLAVTSAGACCTYLLRRLGEIEKAEQSLATMPSPATR
jgi:hypothetical protein